MKRSTLQQDRRRKGRAQSASRPRRADSQKSEPVTKKGARPEHAKALKTLGHKANAVKQIMSDRPMQGPNTLGGDAANVGNDTDIGDLGTSGGGGLAGPQLY